MEEVKEYDYGNAIVRIHFGKRSEEKRQVAWVESAKEFWKSAQKAAAAKGKMLVVDGDGRIVVVSKHSNGSCGVGVQ